MGERDYADLIDRLGGAALECRQLISEAHAATKDLRQATKEARAEIQRVLYAKWDDQVEGEVKAYLEEYGKQMDAAIESGTQAVFARFDTLRDILLGEGKEANGRPTIPELVDRKVAQRRIAGSG